MKFKFKNFVNLSREEKVQVLELRNSESIRKNMYNTDIISIDSHLNWINSLGNRLDCFYWAIFIDNELIGVIDLTSIDNDKKFAEWGFYICNKYFGLGALIEYLGMEHFIFDLKFEKILACVYENNEKVYNMHKNKFNYIDSPEFSFIKDKKKYNGLVLTKQNWEAKRKTIKNLLSKIYKINEVFWEK